MKKTCVVALNLEPEVIEEIDRRSGGPCLHSGRRSGRADWIRQRIYEILNFEPKRRWHDRGTELENIDWSAVKKWFPLAVEVLKLLREGATFEQVADIMTLRGERLPRGGRWTRSAVYWIVLRAKKLSSRPN